jgi:hypothetical protein
LGRWGAQSVLGLRKQLDQPNDLGQPKPVGSQAHLLARFVVKAGQLTGVAGQ